MKRLLLTVVLLGMISCSNMFFYPKKEHLFDPASVGLTAEDIYFESDGVRLHGWLLPSIGPAKGTVLFLHGNAENISTHIGAVHWLPARAYNVFLFDYRGYGKSEGSAEIDGIHTDVEAALREVCRNDAIPSERVILFGQSLGGSLAIQLLATTEFRSCVERVVIESAFSSYRAIASEKLDSFFLTRIFSSLLVRTINDEYSAELFIDKISPIPLLMIHGELDEIVPYHHGERLFELAGEPKTFIRVPGGRHTSALNEERYQEQFLSFIEP